MSGSGRCFCVLCPRPWPRFPHLTFHLCGLCLGARQGSPSASRPATREVTAAANTCEPSQRQRARSSAEAQKVPKAGVEGPCPAPWASRHKEGLVTSSGISRQGGGLLLRARCLTRREKLIILTAVNANYFTGRKCTVKYARLKHRRRKPKACDRAGLL